MATSSEAVKIQEFPSDTAKLLQQLFKGCPGGFCRFGAGGYVLPACFAAHADALRRMIVRRDDVWVVTYPRSGTTLTQEMVWLLENNLDYEAAFGTFLFKRYIFIEVFTLLHEQLQNPDLLNLNDEIKEAQESVSQEDYKFAESATSPRFFKTHLPLSLLPAALLATSRVVYVARDPRDVAVSFYHLSRLMKYYNFTGDFRSFWDLFVADAVPYSPFFSHLKEAWAHRDHPNMLFMFYEDIIKDKQAAIRRVSKFIGKDFSDDEIRKLCDHLDIDNFKNNDSVNFAILESVGIFNKDVEPFIRKGKAGSWRDSFDAGMRRQAARWLRRHLADTDLRFPGDSDDDE